MSRPHAPLIPLTELDPELYAKVEYLHPSGTIKHRSLPALVEARKRSGAIQPGQRIAVLSAGAGAMAVAWAGARLGHPVLAVLPRGAPPQIVRLLRWLGAACEQIDASELDHTAQRLREDASTYLLPQASDPEIPDGYRPVTREILESLGDAPRAITVGIGTGATISGMGRELRQAGSACRLVGVEPAEAQVASGRPWAPHSLPGLAPPIPQVLLDRALLDQIEPVASVDAWRTAQSVHRRAGLPIGPSSGAAVAAALTLRERGLKGAIVAVCPSSMLEYVDGAPPLGEPCASPT
jgi:cysteine synthase